MKLGVGRFAMLGQRDLQNVRVGQDPEALPLIPDEVLCQIAARGRLAVAAGRAERDLPSNPAAVAAQEQGRQDSVHVR